ncbi:MAG: glycosyltransferase [Planctomycetota bacterium]
MRVLLASVGSHGDINPFIAIGRALAARGHDAVLMANPYYKGQIEEAGAGLRFAPMGEFLDLKLLHQSHPDIMHPRKGFWAVLGMIRDGARDAFTSITEMATGGWVPDVIVHHHICLGAAWAAERLGVARAATVLAPAMWLAHADTSCMYSWMPLKQAAVFRWLMLAAARPAMRLLIDRPLHSVRRELGLPPARNLYVSATLEGELNLGMWSPTLREPFGIAGGDPPEGVVCGFPWHDRHDEQESSSDEVERFLKEGEPPILFSLGTAAVHVAGDFYQSAADACAILGRRGLLLVGPGRLPPARMPEGTRAFEYVPFSRVMPRCAVNVHHGGIGSTGQGMRAGRPTVVIPHAHDQFDNAARLKRHGLSATLRRPKVTPASLAMAIRSVLDDPKASERAALVARRLADEDGALRAAIEIERIGGCIRR